MLTIAYLPGQKKTISKKEMKIKNHRLENVFKI